MSARERVVQIPLLGKLSAEKVTLFGSVLGLLTLTTSFITLKPNRVAEGTAYGFFELGEPVLTAIVAGSLMVALALSFLGQSVRIRYAKVLSGVALFSASLVLLATTSSLVEQQQLEFGRITPGVGFWLVALVTFIIIDGSLRNAPMSRGTKSFIGSLPLLLVAIALASGSLDHLALVQEFQNRQSRFVQELLNHIYLAFTAVGVAVLIGVPLGLAAWRRQTLEKPVFVLVNGIQTIPSLALFGLMIAPLAFLSRQLPVLRELGIQGIGNAPALIALTLYSLLPITRNTYTSLAVIPDGVIDAGTGVGMSPAQLLRFVEIPMAVPIVLSGIRVSAVQAIGNTAVAALIGAGGLGNFVFQGLGQAAPDLIVMGVLPIIFLAVFVDRMFGAVIYRLTPPSLRKKFND